LQNICITTAFPTTTTSRNNAKTLHTQNKTKQNTMPNFLVTSKRKTEKKTQTHARAHTQRRKRGKQQRQQKKEKRNTAIDDKLASERARRELGKKHRSRAIPHVQTVN
jgi:hypothetical protein